MAAPEETSREKGHPMTPTELADIVTRLRDAKMGDAAEVAFALDDLCLEAANEIERLRAYRAGTMPSEEEIEGLIRAHVGAWLKEDRMPSILGGIPTAAEQDVRELASALSALLSPKGSSEPVADRSAALALAGRLRHCMATASNDDYSEAGTDKRDRHVTRIDAMGDAATFLEAIVDDGMDQPTNAMADQKTCATCHAVLADGPQPAATYAAKTDCCRQYAMGLPFCMDCPATTQSSGKPCRFNQGEV